MTMSQSSIGVKIFIFFGNDYSFVDDYQTGQNPCMLLTPNFQREAILMEADHTGRLHLEATPAGRGVGHLCRADEQWGLRQSLFSYLGLGARGHL